MIDLRSKSITSRTQTYYRIVQEAVTNAATHAGVNEAAVTLKSEDGVIIAEIRDEGCGFELSDSGTARDDGHIGLAGDA